MEPGFSYMWELTFSELPERKWVFQPARKKYCHMASLYIRIQELYLKIIPIPQLSKAIELCLKAHRLLYFNFIDRLGCGYYGRRGFNC